MTVDLTRLEALAARIPRPAQLVSNRAPWYRIDNATGDRAELSIYGPIDNWDGISAASFVADLKQITASSIDLHINSPGGLVFDSVAIFTALKRHPANVAVHIDGIAASAASFIAMAGDSVEIEKPARMMIHDAQGLTVGGPAEHREMLNLLDELSDGIADIYAERTGKPASQWRTAMGKDTWYSAEQAVKAGLADRIAGSIASGADAMANSVKSQLVRARARVALKGAK